MGPRASADQVIARLWQTVFANPWIWLGAIGCAELLTWRRTAWGLGIYAVLVFSLLLAHAQAREINVQRFTLSLLVIPISRLSLFSLPLLELPLLVWYPIMSVVTGLAGWLIFRQTNRTWLGLRINKLNGRRLVLLLSYGYGLGLVQHHIIPPPFEITRSDWGAVGLVWLIFGVCAGIEAMVFRGLLQTLNQPLVGRWTPWYNACLATLLQASNTALPSAVLIFVVSLSVAYLLAWRVSLVEIALLQAIANALWLCLPPMLMPSSLLVMSMCGLSAISLLIVWLSSNECQHTA